MGTEVEVQFGNSLQVRLPAFFFDFKCFPRGEEAVTKLRKSLERVFSASSGSTFLMSYKNFDVALAHGGQENWRLGNSLVCSRQANLLAAAVKYPNWVSWILGLCNVSGFGGLFCRPPVISTGGHPIPAEKCSSKL